MPSKHIKQETWDKIEKIRIKGIIQAKADIKERDILEMILEKGIRELDEVDIDQLASNRR